MSEYTKDQEREALEAVEGGLSGRKLPIDLDVVRVVFAMAKRTAGVEMKLAACRAGSERWHAVALESQQERDALRAQLATVTRERDGLAQTSSIARESVVVAVRIAELERERDHARIYAADREALALQLDAAKETIQFGIELLQKAERERDELERKAHVFWAECLEIVATCPRCSTPSAEPRGGLGTPKTATPAQALVERLLGALVNAEEMHVTCECPTADGDGCTCTAPTQWRAVINEARAALASTPSAEPTPVAKAVKP